MKRIVIFAAVAVCGCYGYYPVAQNGARATSRDVLVRLSDSGSVVLARAVGPAVASITGRLSADSSTSLIIAATSTHTRDGNDVAWRGERLVIPRALVTEVSERRFSRARTGLFAGAAAVVMYAVREAFTGTGAGSGGSGLPGGVGRK